MRKRLIAYALFLLSFVGLTYLFVDLNLTYLNPLVTGFFQSHRGIVAILYILALFILFYFYRIFLEVSNISSLKKIIIVTVTILIFAYPAMLSYDIFNYIFTSKVLFFYHENPYIIMPIEFTGDPLLLFTHAANKVALYGPSWILITGIPFLLGFGNFILTLFSFKLVIAAFYLATSYLIFKISKDPGKVAFFALNPLVLIESLVSGHNDVVMIFFALLSINLLIKNKFKWAVLFLIISILIKYATIFLLLVFLHYLFIRIKKKKIDPQRLFMFSSVLMLVVFFLSPIREEIYPWYAIWFIAFVALIPKYRFLRYMTVLISFVLLLRYLPFMYLGTYFAPTPVIKITVTFVPLVIFACWYFITNKHIRAKLLKLK